MCACVRVRVDGCVCACESKCVIERECERENNKRKKGGETRG